jgi:hypothetical protein
LTPAPSERCIGRLGDSRSSSTFTAVRCGRFAVADGYCNLHHPFLKQERIERGKAEQRLRQARAEWERGGQLFWAQVAICALLQYLKKAAPEHADALARRL